MLLRLTHNWTLKITALVLSLALWSHVRGQVNPWELTSFKVRLDVDTPRGFVLQDADKLPRMVTVAVRGPRQTLRQLKGGTPANPLSTGDDATLIASRQLRASLDFSMPHKGIQKVPIKAETTWEDIEVLGAKPNEVTVMLDVAARKDVRVDPEIELPKEWRATNIKPSEEMVQVSGASKVLARVASVRAVVTGKYSGSGEIVDNHVTLEAVDDEGQTIEGLRLDPSVISVKAKIVENLEEKTVPVKIRTQGSPAHGHDLGALEVEPESLTIRGPRRLLEKIDSLTESIDIDGAGEDIIRRIKISVPTGVEIIGANRVRVHVGISAKTSAAPAPRNEGDSGTISSHGPLPAPAPSPATP
jgi:YbbR domain-containing protein